MAPSLSFRTCSACTSVRAEAVSGRWLPAAGHKVLVEENARAGFLPRWSSTAPVTLHLESHDFCIIRKASAVSHHVSVATAAA